MNDQKLMTGYCPICDEDKVVCSGYTVIRCPKCHHHLNLHEADFHAAWYFLSGHPMFDDHFSCDLDIMVVKVDPETLAINLDDNSKNTHTRIWLEHGPYDDEWGVCAHDIDLDCGGDTFEEAVIELAKLVKWHYTDDGEKIEERSWWNNRED